MKFWIFVLVMVFIGNVLSGCATAEYVSVNNEQKPLDPVAYPEGCTDEKLRYDWNDCSGRANTMFSYHKTQLTFFYSCMEQRGYKYNFGGQNESSAN